MKKIVIYDSYFGNTQTIAEAIAKELECDSIKVQIFNEDVINNYDLVVLGSPTRKFGPTKEIKNLAKLIEGHGTKVALFDTRIDVKDELPKILLRMIKKKGYSNDTLELYQSGILKEHSVGFVTITKEQKGESSVKQFETIIQYNAATLLNLN